MLREFQKHRPWTNYYVHAHSRAKNNRNCHDACAHGWALTLLVTSLIHLYCPTQVPSCCFRCHMTYDPIRASLRHSLLPASVNLNMHLYAYDTKKKKVYLPLWSNNDMDLKMKEHIPQIQKYRNIGDSNNLTMCVVFFFFYDISVFSFKSVGAEGGCPQDWYKLDRKMLQAWRCQWACDMEWSPGMVLWSWQCHRRWKLSNRLSSWIAM